MQRRWCSTTPLSVFQAKTLKIESWVFQQLILFDPTYFKCDEHLIHIPLQKHSPIWPVEMAEEHFWHRIGQHISRWSPLPPSLKMVK